MRLYEIRKNSLNGVGDTEKISNMHLYTNACIVFLIFKIVPKVPGLKDMKAPELLGVPGLLALQPLISRRLW